MITHPLPLGTKVGIKSARHDFTTAYLSDALAVCGGGYRYEAVFVPSGMRAKVYSDEIVIVLTKNEAATLRWLAKGSH